MASRAPIKLQIHGWARTGCGWRKRRSDYGIEKNRNDA
jgi:hypothetical protein